jgi:hypothetical protein
MNDEWGWWVRALAYATFAALGGVMGHLMRTVDGKRKIHWGRACLEGAAAGFVGLLMLFLCEANGLGQQWTGVIVGVSGWLGASGTIRMLETIVRKKLGIEPPTNQG